MTIDPEHLRLVEALLFASPEPVDETDIAARLPVATDVRGLLQALIEHYRGRGIEPVFIAGKWRFRTAPDLAERLRLERAVKRRLSRAAMETLSVIAYHQPVTRAEIEEIRGVSLGRGTLDVLLEADWVAPGKRRETPGRPVTWVTTSAFLEHFSLGGLQDLPGLEEVRALGLFEMEPKSPLTPPSDDDAE